MDRKTASRLLTENLTQIYGYAASNLFDRSRTDDLAAEIVVEVLGSVENLRDDFAFWGFVWRTAENTLRKFIRREELRKKAEITFSGFEGFEAIPAPGPNPEDDASERSEEEEQIRLIRRELSLLTKTRREVTVRYYIRNKSVGQIAKELGISADMVKYHLYMARNQMKEGIKMERKLGKFSVDPGVFRLNFWGDWNHYGSIIDRKIREAVMLAAYEEPMTAEELSAELGVAMPYLEDEIETLEAAGLLLKTGRKYQNNIPILTLDCQREVEEKTKPLYPEFAKEIYDDLKALLPEVRKLDFKGSDFDDNRLLFMLLNMVALRSYDYSQSVSPAVGGRDLPLGGHGHLWGLDNDWEINHFQGVVTHCSSADEKSWFAAANYNAIGKCQCPCHSYDFGVGARLINDAIFEKTVKSGDDKLAELVEGGIISCRDGKLSANFQVFREEVFTHLVEEMLRPTVEKMSEKMIEVSNVGGKLLAASAPARLRSQCGDIAKITFRLDVGAITVEQMLADGLLVLPEWKVPLCIYGVKTGE